MKLVVAVKREARDKADPDLLQQVRAIEGVTVLGEWPGHQLQLEVTVGARAEIERRFGAWLHIEAAGVYQPRKT